MARNEKEPVLSDRLVEHDRRGLEKVLDSISDGLGKFACNEEFTVLYFSDGLAALSEVDRVDVEKQGFNSDIYIHVDDRQMVRQAIMDAVAANEPFTCTYRLYRKEGGFRWVKARRSYWRGLSRAVSHHLRVLHRRDRCGGDERATKRGTGASAGSHGSNGRNVRGIRSRAR